MKIDEHKGNKRKKGKMIKESSECPNLIFGVDLQFNSVMAASELILVGRARDKVFSADYIFDWIQRSWVEAPEGGAEVITLSKGWFMVKFKKIETLEWVLA